MEENRKQTELLKKENDQSRNFFSKVSKEVKLTFVYLYKVTVRAIRKRSLKIIVPIVLVLFVFGLFLISDPELNKQEVLNELSTRLNLPQGEADVRTVGSDSIIAKEDAFLQGSKDNYVLVSYPGLDILYNQDANEVVRSRSYTVNREK